MSVGVLTKDIHRPVIVGKSQHALSRQMRNCATVRTIRTRNRQYTIYHMLLLSLLLLLLAGRGAGAWARTLRVLLYTVYYIICTTYSMRDTIYYILYTIYNILYIICSC